MPQFKYKALHDDKTSYEATVEAKDRFEVYTIVRKEGGEVISVRELPKNASMLANLHLPFIGRVKESDKIMLMRNLSSMLVAGLPISRALNVMERQTKATKLKEILQGIQQDIQQGSDLNTSLGKYKHVFSPLVIAMVKAGEESGSLHESLRIIADQLERVYELKKKVRGAMIYPSVILSVLLAVGMLMMIYIVPTLTATFRSMGSELPASTQLIVNISDFLVEYTLLTIVGILAAIGAFILFARTRFGKSNIETVVLHIPIIGQMVSETNSARTGRTLASLLSAGVQVIHAFEITEEVIQNTHYQKVLAKARDQVQKGSPIAEIFIQEDKLYPPLVGELIAVGEETGNLPDMLKEIAIFYEKEVDQKTKNMSTIIEPFLMVVVGAAVGYFALAMISPIYGVMENI